MAQSLIFRHTSELNCFSSEAMINCQLLAVKSSFLVNK
ncbi:hypothetical protein N0824_02921 [Microcystis sp. 0824]|nr:hypothetical protein N0824_02921 [Microcystis sp. 0824]